MGSISCKNCQQSFEGKFCPSCGEKVLSDNDFKLKSYLLQGLDIFTHLDSKISKSIILLVKKPGLLTLNNWNGIRVPYAKPIQLFFVLNALFFLLNQSTVNFNIFNTPLKYHMEYFNYSDYARDKVNVEINEKGVSFSEYEKDFNRKTDNLSKTLIFVMIPFLALLLYIIFYRKREFFVHHLIFATHFFSFILLYCIFMIGFTMLFALINSLVPALNVMSFLNDATFSTIGIIFMSFYFYNSFKTCFNISAWLNIILTAGFIYSIYYILEFYRLILFLIVSQLL